MERFMRMEDDQLHAAQMHSMAADEMEALIPTISDAADAKDGEPHLGQLPFLNLHACIHLYGASFDWAGAATCDKS